MITVHNVESVEIKHRRILRGKPCHFDVVEMVIKTTDGDQRIRLETERMDLSFREVKS